MKGGQKKQTTKSFQQLSLGWHDKNREGEDVKEEEEILDEKYERESLEEAKEHVEANE